MSFDQWVEIYQPYMEDGNIIAWDFQDPSNKDIIFDAAEENRLWSLIEEDGIMWLESGLCIDNCFGIIICKVPCDKNVSPIHFWSENNERKMLMDKLNSLRDTLTYKELQKLALEELQELEEKLFS